jgi:hypothetical protein
MRGVSTLARMRYLIGGFAVCVSIGIAGAKRKATLRVKPKNA